MCPAAACDLTSVDTRLLMAGDILLMVVTNKHKRASLQAKVSRYRQDKEADKFIQGQIICIGINHPALMSCLSRIKARDAGLVKT